MKETRYAMSVQRNNGRAFVGLLALAIHAWAAQEQEEVRYTFDAGGRLVTAACTAGFTNAAVHYQYDANGNRTKTVAIAANDLSVDSNGDGIADLGALVHFGGLEVDGAADPDGDGLVNSNELNLAGNPFVKDTDDDRQDDLDESIAGTALNDPGSSFRITRIDVSADGVVRVWWDGRKGRSYRLLQAGKLGAVWTDAAPEQPCPADQPFFLECSAVSNAFFRTRVRLTP